VIAINFYTIENILFLIVSFYAPSDSVDKPLDLSTSAAESVTMIPGIVGVLNWV
jgi:hypothetical protein